MSWQSLGQVYLKLNQIASATKALNKAKMNCSGCYEPVDVLVDLYLHTKQFAKAKNELSSYLAVKGIDQKQAAYAKSRLMQIRR